MAKITPYQQGQLASSVVGTPGADMSGSSMLSAVGNQLEAIGAAQHQDFLKVQRQKQAEVDAQQKLIENMKRKTDVANTGMAAEVDMQKSMNDLQMQYADKPDQAYAAFQQDQSQKIQAATDNVADPQTKAMLTEHLTQKYATKVGEMGEWVKGQQVPLARKALDESAGNLSNLTGQMANKSPDDVKSTIDQYVNTNKNQYHFFSQNGTADLTKVGSDAVRQYLESVAASGDPEALKKTATAFADGKYIKPSELQQIYIQQRGIAAQERMAQNAEDTKSDINARMNFQQQAIQLGNGDPKNASAAALQRAYEQAAPNMKPETRLRVQQEVLNQVHEQNVKTADTSAILAKTNAEFSNEMGAWDSKDIQNAINDPNTSQGLKDSLIQEQAKRAHMAQGMTEDQHMAHTIGGYVQGVKALSGIIMQNVSNLNTIKDPTKHAQALQQLQIDADRYSDAYSKLKSLHAAIKDPTTKALTDFSIKPFDSQFKNVSAYLGGDKNALAMHQATENYYGLVHPQTIYPQNPKLQATYEFLYKTEFYNQIQNFKVSADDLNGKYRNPQYIQKMKSIAAQKAGQLMHQYKLVP